MKADDGLVRVEFQTEKPGPFRVPRFEYYDTYPYWQNWWYWPNYPQWRRKGDLPKTIWGGQTSGLSSTSAVGSACVKQMSLTSAQAGNPGITVAGSESDQKFYSTDGFEVLPGTDVIVLHLHGTKSARAVAKAVTVKAKPECSTCGKKNKAQDQFCGRCGTALTLF